MFPTQSTGVGSLVGELRFSCRAAHPKNTRKQANKACIYKSAQQAKANQVNKAFSENRAKWSLHVQRNVEADVEKQSFPNLSVKFLFKDN